MAGKDLLAQFGDFLEAQQKQADDARAAEHDGDDFEWWEEGKDGQRRGGRTTVRAARHHGPEWVKGFFADEGGKDEGGKDEGGKDEGAGKVPTLFPRGAARKPAAGQ